MKTAAVCIAPIFGTMRVSLSASYRLKSIWPVRDTKENTDANQAEMKKYLRAAGFTHYRTPDRMLRQL